MAISLGPAWKCESCGNVSFGYGERPWDCPVCGEETCEYCFSMYMVCNKCAEGYTEEEIKQMSIDAGYEWDD